VLDKKFGRLDVFDGVEWRVALIVSNVDVAAWTVSLTAAQNKVAIPLEIRYSRT
jgi:hypothetical protein